MPNKTPRPVKVVEEIDVVDLINDFNASRELGSGPIKVLADQMIG